MASETPKIDPRSYADLVAETTALVEAYTGWRRYDLVAPDPGALHGPVLAKTIPPAAGAPLDDALARELSAGQDQSLGRVGRRPDAGGALIRIFARLAQIAVERINQVPDKNFLVYLELIGARPRPARAARAPLTFRLTPGRRGHAFVPARTQVAAELADGRQVTFETDDDLTVTAARLQTVFARDPAADRYGDYSAPATGAAEQPFPAFQGDTPIEHSLYLAHDALFELPWQKTVTLAVALTEDDAKAFNKLPLAWTCWDGADWRPLAAEPSVSGSRWSLSLTNPPTPAPLAIAGCLARWVRAELNSRIFRATEESGALMVEAPKTDEFGAAGIEWSLWDGTAWQSLGGPTVTFENETIMFRFEESAPTPPGSSTPERWARARFGSSALRAGGRELPRVSGLSLTVTGVQGQGVAPDHALANSQPLDTSKDFLPFGERPRRGDALYIASAAAFGLPGARAELQVEVSAGARATIAGAPALTWEVWTDAGWQAVTVEDTTASLTSDGSVRFTVPAGIARGAVGGVDSCWLRARLSSGNYGEDATYIANPYDARKGTPFAARLQVTARQGNNPAPAGTQVTFTITLTNTAPKFDNAQATAVVTTNAAGVAIAPLIIAGSATGTFTVTASVPSGFSVSPPDAFTLTVSDNGPAYVPIPATFAPPSLSQLRVAVIAYDLIAPPAACLTCNDAVYLDQTAAAAAGGFAPFTRTADREPALYLGFDQPFENRPLNLYAHLDPAAAAGPSPGEAWPRVVWEYAAKSPAGGAEPFVWAPLGERDETASLSRRGLLRFVGPADAVASTQLGQTRYWLRGRRSGAPEAPGPLLRRLSLNTVWATEGVTVEAELLGSSDGSPGQLFRAAQAPVLEGQVVEVREREVPPHEREALLRLSGTGAITPVPGPDGRPDSFWVLWEPVADFYTSGPRDRHYCFEQQTGELRFGDGARGMVPPPGRNAVRLARYRVGGGAHGNCHEGSIARLLAPPPYVEGVSNLEPAAGGADPEPIDEVRAHGPHLLRHRGRAVAHHDYVDLAHAASPAVARAGVVTPTFDPEVEAAPGDEDAHMVRGAGLVRLVIAPRAAAPWREPMAELIEQVRAYVLARCPPTVKLELAAPRWVEVHVSVTVVPSSPGAAQHVASAVDAALRSYLHPLSGAGGAGWPFGCWPHHSELYALIAGVPGVDHAYDLRVEPDATGDADTLIYSGRHAIAVAPPTSGA